MERVMNLPITFVVPTTENNYDGKYLMPRKWTWKDLEIQMKSGGECLWYPTKLDYLESPLGNVN